MQSNQLSQAKQAAMQNLAAAQDALEAALDSARTSPARMRACQKRFDAACNRYKKVAVKEHKNTS